MSLARSNNAPVLLGDRSSKSNFCVSKLYSPKWLLCSLVSCLFAVINTMTKKKTQAATDLFQLTLPDHRLSWREVGAGTQGRSSTKNPQRKLFTGLLTPAYIQPGSLYNSGPPSKEWHHLQWPNHNQDNSLTDRAMAQCDLNGFFHGDTLFPGDSGLCQVRTVVNFISRVFSFQDLVK